MTRRRLHILGSTGSIGVQALDVLVAHPERLELAGLATGGALDALCAQAQRHRPRALALERAGDVGAARARLQEACPGARVFVGEGAAANLVAEIECDVVLNGIVGAAGLGASLAGLRRGARLALANKETLVVGGPLVRAALAAGGELVPVDSEHSAALQCLAGRPAAEVAKLTLTASGGALRDHPDWRSARPEEVLAHPVWAMGRRITVDSALLFNKGLELIEAHWLFDLDWDQLDAVLHREARFHALAAFRDGSMVAQAAAADMRLPIQLALSWPEHWPGPIVPPRPADLAGLSFAPIPPGRHPAYDLALAAGRAGGTAPCALNAADEVAVEAYLAGRIALGRVPEVIAEVMDAHKTEAVESLDQLQAADAHAREAARAALPAIVRGMNTAVVVSTYENPRALDLTLRAWARQGVAPGRVIVADDGSGPETAAVVTRWHAEHVRLEHGEGFGKCRVVNTAIVKARDLGADWLLLTDGDWLPARDLLARHVEESRPRRFVVGGGIRLSREASQELTDADVDSGRFERLGGNKPHYRLPRPIGHVLDHVQPRRTPWKGGNSSAWLKDILSVGGYDERFGWGLEDNEMGERLENSGIRGFSIRYSAPAYHLWHERTWVDPEALKRHQVMLEETRRTRTTRTEFGIQPQSGPSN